MTAGKKGANHGEWGWKKNLSCIEMKYFDFKDCMSCKGKSEKVPIDKRHPSRFLSCKYTLFCHEQCPGM
eukprot:scaffold6992_cov102-Cylindrotheca_fusiformis.AAC.2